MDVVESDLVVVGGGPGGYVAAIRASGLGKDVVLVERARLGGVCLNEGCVPTKALIATARACEAMGRAGKMGLRVPEGAGVDQPAAAKRARGVADRMSKGVRHLMKASGVRVVEGTGKLVSPGRVDVAGGPSVRAGAVVLAAGARPRPLPGIPFDGERVITSTDAMWLEAVPERLLVVGAGAIGMEFAYYYAVAGSRVTVVEALPSILPFADPDAVKAVARAMRRRKIEMVTGAKVEKVVPGDGVVTVELTVGEERRTVEADRVLVAIGVVPNTEDLWEPAAAPELDGPWVRTDGFGRTSVEGVWAIGDLKGPPLLAHAASHEGIVAAERIAGVEHGADPGAHIPGVVYCQPQVAQVGITEAQAREAGVDVVTGTYPMVASCMAQAAGESDGFVKLVFRAGSGRLAGATVVGAEAAELLSETCLAMEQGLTHEQIARTVHPHPTFAEAVMEAAAAACGRGIHI